MLFQQKLVASFDLCQGGMGEYLPLTYIHTRINQVKVNEDKTMVKEIISKANKQVKFNRKVLL